MAITATSTDNNPYKDPKDGAAAQDKSGTDVAVPLIQDELAKEQRGYDHALLMAQRAHEYDLAQQQAQ